jgi:hypothetical protein
MKIPFAICVAALAAVACSKADEAGETPGAGAAAKRMPLPDCAMAQTVDAGADGWKHPDCRLMLTAASKLAIEARYTAAEDDSTKVTVQVVAPGDATMQTIEETMGNTFEPVSLVDIDKDGRIDIRIPLETGNVNTNWALWRQKEDKSFVRIGEPSGVSIVNTASGYIAVQARSSANEWDVEFYKLVMDALQPIATVTVTAQGEPDKITGVDCSVTDDGALAALGLSGEAAKTQFCAEPVVAEIFKQ